MNKNWDQTRIILSNARRDRGFTQRELAERVGVHQSLISDWEYGRVMPRVTSLVTWANGLQVTLAVHIARGAVEYTVTDAKTGQTWQ